jgi:hypothetical protein
MMTKLHRELTRFIGILLRELILSTMPPAASRPPPGFKMTNPKAAVLHGCGNCHTTCMLQYIIYKG